MDSYEHSLPKSEKDGFLKIYDLSGSSQTV